MHSAIQLFVAVMRFLQSPYVCFPEGENSPCDLFSKISFPTDAFFPRPADCDDECNCAGCRRDDKEDRENRR